MATKSIGLLKFIRRTLWGLVCALLLAGCGPRGRQSGGPVTVHLAYFPNVTHAAALVGSGRGTFAKAFAAKNARLEEQTFTAGPSEMEALFAGAVDIGFVGPGPALNAYLRSDGAALRIIAGASSGGAGLVARQGVGIKSWADLHNKRVAVPQIGGTQDVSLRHYLSEAGLAPRNKNGDVDVVQYPPAVIAHQLGRGELDAAYVAEPWLSVLQQKNHADLVFDERSAWPGGKFATTVVVVRAAFLEAHPDLVKAFLDAHLENIAWANAHPSETRALVGAQIKNRTTRALPNAVLRSALSRTQITSDPLPASVLTFADWAKQLGYARGIGETTPAQAVFAFDLLNAGRKSYKLPPVFLTAPRHQGEAMPRMRSAHLLTANYVCRHEK